MICPKCNIALDDSNRCPLCGVERFPQSIHPVKEDDGLIMYWVNPGDGGDAHLVGEFWQVAELRDRLNDLINDGVHGGELEQYDPLVQEWITVKEASQLTDISARSIRRACTLGKIEHAEPEPWHFPLRSFRRWLHDTRAHLPGRK